eukprot:GEMP01005836.1.p1 GENE.GEMP01005836.1~~GEMP01005836.1.p1  ORF type:complete len:875 (+),score=121.87 GEMP01005836.1:43-2667(+)
MRTNKTNTTGFFSCTLPLVASNLCADACSSRTIDNSLIHGGLMRIQRPLDLKLDRVHSTSLGRRSRPLNFVVPNEETGVEKVPTSIRSSQQHSTGPLTYTNDFKYAKEALSEAMGFSPRRYYRSSSGRSSLAVQKLGIPAVSVPITPSSSSVAGAIQHQPLASDLMSLHEQFGKHLQRCADMLRQNDDMEMALRGATEIRQVLTAPGEPPIQQILKCDVVPGILSCLSMSDEPSLQMEAAVTLRVLCSGTANQISTVLATPDVIPGLVGAIHSAVNKVRQEALMAMSRLARNDGAARDAIFTNGGVGPICAQALLQKVLGTQRLATMTLACVLSGSPPAVHPSIENSALPTLVHLLRSTEDDEVLSNVLLGLTYVSKGGLKVAATECLVADSEGVCRLFRCLVAEDGKQDMMSTALGIVGSICMGSKQHVHVLVKHGLLDHLCKLIQSQNVVMRKCTCNILSNVLTEHQLAPPYTGRLFGSLAFVLRADVDTVQREAMWAAYNAAEYGGPAQVTELVIAGFIPIFIHKLTHSDFEMVGQALQALLRILEVGALTNVENNDLDSPAQLLKNPFVSKMEEGGAIPVLDALQQKSNVPDTIHKNLSNVLALCGHSISTVLDDSDHDSDINLQRTASNILFVDRVSAHGASVQRGYASGVISKKSSQHYADILGRIEKHRSKTFTPKNTAKSFTNGDNDPSKPYLEPQQIGAGEPELQRSIGASPDEPRTTPLLPTFLPKTRYLGDSKLLDGFPEAIRGHSPGRSTCDGSALSMDNNPQPDFAISVEPPENKMHRAEAVPKALCSQELVNRLDRSMTLEEELLAANRVSAYSDDVDENNGSTPVLQHRNLGERTYGSDGSVSSGRLTTNSPMCATQNE